MKSRTLFTLIFITALSVNSACSPERENPLKNVRYTSEDSLKCMEVIEIFKDYKPLPSAELATQIAIHFMGTTYVASTLEIEPEALTISLLKTDCILFVEMCSCLALTIKSENPSFEKYCDNIREMRYINGVVDGYASRNHYTSGWIIQNEQRGLMEEITLNVGGKESKQSFSFMSKNADKYDQLKKSPELIPAIKKVEESLNEHKYYSLPKNSIDLNKDKIKNGDIVCFVSSLEGIDVSHVGFAYYVGKELHFIHASSSQMEVVIEKKTLQEYTKTGIRVVRLN